MTELQVNGRHCDAAAAGTTALLDVLREELGLRGTRAGCREGVCGACRVLVAGRPVAACQTPLETVRGQAVTTVEGLPRVLRDAFEAEQAAQCGYCSAGMLVAAAALLAQTDEPSEAQIRRALDGQHCRCGAQPRIVRAVRRAAAARLAGGAARAADAADAPGMPGMSGEGPADVRPAQTLPASCRPRFDGPAEPAQAGPVALQRHPRPSDWLQPSADGLLEVRSGKVEIGQGIQRALACLVAQALGWPLAQVRVSHPCTATHPDEGVTSGSLSVQDSGAALRCMATALRQRLCARAARAWGLAPSQVDLVDGLLLGPGGLREPALAWLDRQVLDDPLTPQERGAWPPTVSGQTQAAPTSGAEAPAGSSEPGTPLEPARWHPTLTRAAVFSGEPHFIHDLYLPGMLHGMALHPPGLGDRLAPAADQVLARVLPTLRAGPAVLDAWRDGELVGVIAARADGVREACARLRQALAWDPADPAGHGGTDPRAWPGQPGEPRTVDERAGPVGAAAGPTRRLTARYTRPWLAHASVGPSCALARWAAPSGRPGTVMLEVWTHSQGIFGLRRDLALAFGLAEGAVVVRHVPGAGCYGHNGADDVAFDAAWLALRVPGTPVRCEWSRADDLARAPLGPAMCIELEAEIDAAGKVRAWRHELWSPGHSSRPGRSPTPALLGQAQRAGGTPLPEPIDMPLAVGGGAERNAVPGYDLPAWRIVAHRVRAPWRSSALRSLGALGNVFAAESFVDELARATGCDPLAWREQGLAHDPRGRAVLRAAAARAGWLEKRAPAGPARVPGDGAACGRGIGYARYKLTGAWCAVVAEVRVGAALEVRRLVVAADIGRVIDPDGATMQLEGAALQATGFALKESVEPGADGRLPPEGADAVAPLSFTEMPEVDVVLLPSAQAPLGAGEAAIGPTVAAIANALADALGVRVRDLPLTRERIVAAIEESDP